MKWSDYYERFWDWSEQTQIKRITSLTDFTSAEEVVEIAGALWEEEAASQLVRCALQGGIRFTPEEIIDLEGCVTDEVLNEIVRNRKGEFDAHTFQELKSFCFDEALLNEVARAGKLRRECDDLPFDSSITLTRPIERGPGLIETLLSIASESSSRNSSNTRNQRRCTGDCDHCPAHYGYRYGRWYYGHHHVYGCEFGGNDGSGEL